MCKHDVPRINEVFSHKVNNREKESRIGKGEKSIWVLGDILIDMRKSDIGNWSILILAFVL